MRRDPSYQVRLERRADRWFGSVPGLESEIRGRSIEGVVRRTREQLAALFSHTPDDITLHMVFVQDELAELATRAASVRHEAEVAIAAQRQRERRELTRLARALDDNYDLSNRDIGSLVGVAHRTVGQLISQS